MTGGSGADRFAVDTYYGTDTITDFEDGVDRVELYGGLAITSWQGLDSDGDGSVDAQAALLSNGERLILLGHAAPPASLVDGSGVTSIAAQFAIPELTQWSMAGGWGGF